MNQMLKNKFLWLMLILGVSIGLQAGTTGKIAGVVRDAQSGDPLPGANVVVEGTMLGAAADLEGYYFINNLPPGSYTLNVSMIGYTISKIEGIKVSIDFTTEFDVELNQEVLDLGEEIVVVAERDVIKRDLTSSQATVDAEKIADLPVQQVDDVLQLQAGVQKSSEGIHIRGGRATEVAYYVDGISVTDVYNNQIAVDVENASVQELQVISGTFNAEYGQAMSGIVNIVTKDGGDEYHGNVNMYSGDYLSNHDNTFYAIDDIDPLGIKNVQGTLSGPVPFTNNKVKFFATGRYYDTDGYIFGERRYNIDGTPGDSTIVPLAMDKRITGQLKLSYQLTNSIKMRLSGFLSTRENNMDSNDNYRDYKFLPDARKIKYDDGNNLTAQMTHVLSASTFYDVSVSRFFKHYEDYVFENPIDSRYLPSDSLDSVPQYNVKNVGTILGNFERETVTWVGKFDMTSQVNKLHQVKIGFEAKQHDLFYESITPVPKRDDNGVQIDPLEWEIESISSTNHQLYNEDPIELSAYIQDKIEYDDMIINIGLRFDYFDARSQVLVDDSDPNVYNPLNDASQDMTLEEREAIWWQDTEAKYSISPRFGIAYPITKKGVIHFSYGHFFQIPSFNRLFDNPGFKVPATTGIHGVYGNPDLSPQKTVMYEIGLQQQIGENIGIDVTGFYRDIRDWVGVTPPIETVGAGGQTLSGRTYIMYINRDYANIRGISVSMNQSVSRYINFDLDYTFQVAETSNSRADEEFNSIKDNAEPTRMISPADWDETHRLNGSVRFTGSDWGASLIGRFGSGKPYTPSITRAVRLGANANLAFTTNSRRKPTDITFDLQAHKSFQYFGLRYTVRLSVYNLFDRMNQYEVYGDTGLATTSSEYRKVREASLVNNTAEEWLSQPGRFSPPREVHLGIQVDF